MREPTLGRLAVGLAATVLISVGQAEAHGERGTMARAKPVTFYVATNGDDHWTGKRAAPNAQHTDGPFATLARARAAIRQAKTFRAFNGATVLMRGGVYPQAETLTLTAEDGGTSSAPIVWGAYKTETARLVGGREITGFHLVTEEAALSRMEPTCRGHVMQADLKAQGITNYGAIQQDGWNRGGNMNGMEVFFQNKPMQIARWPNTGFATIADVPKEGNGKVIAYSGDRPARWKKAEAGWLHGYWMFDWADSYTPITAVNATAHTITTAGTTDEYGIAKGKRFYALNLLEELDSPGEWYCDRKKGVLYFWPPAPLKTSNVLVSLLDGPLLKLDNAANVTIQGLTIEATRGNGIEINGGKHTRIAGCTIRNTGLKAAIINGGTDNGITGCDIYETGQGGIYLNGGDRKTLMPGGNFAHNNDLHDFSRWIRCYRAGIGVDGVGQRISHNLIYNGPHNGILLGGNDHIIEYNELHDVCRETGDVGAFYLGRDWTMRGNIVRYNYFHHLGGSKAAFGGEGFFDAMGVYLDDAASGTLVQSNVFYKAGRGVLVGGGRDNAVSGNLFVECGPAVSIDARGLGWAKDKIKSGGEWGMYDKLKAVNSNAPPYSTRYPKLATIESHNPAFPDGNSVVGNWCADGKWLELQDGLNDKTVSIENNVVERKPLEISDMGRRNYPLGVLQHFQITTIPFAKIGLVRDASRKKVAPLMRAGDGP